MDPAPRRIVVVDDEPAVVELLRHAFCPPDFEFHAFHEAREALFRLHDLGPELILADLQMPDMDGRAFLKVVKRSAELRDVPFVFLSGVQSNDEIVSLYGDGADDFVGKPFHMGRLVAKVRALLRMSDRRRDALTGPLGPDGPLPLLKFCEDSRLTGRLLVQSRFERRWAEYVGGEIVQTGGEPAADEDPLDALLAVRGGSYRIEQRRLERAALPSSDPAAPAPAPAASEGPLPSLPAGRLSRVDVRGRLIEVQTEAENRPHFTVTTVVARSGQVIRKIENAWQHALQRREDFDLARSQIDRQHDRVVATLTDLATSPPRVEAAPVDGKLLGWAGSFLAEQVRDQAGAVMTAALLRRTHRDLVEQYPPLKAFRVSEDGRVLLGAAELPAAAVEAVAAWCVSFLREGALLVPRLAALRVRPATRMMESELDKAGFYAAVDAISSR